MKHLMTIGACRGVITLSCHSYLCYCRIYFFSRSLYPKRLLPLFNVSTRLKIFSEKVSLSGIGLAGIIPFIPFVGCKD